jgi:protein-L-isoaspartate(D-aspartate) O-methyltransferase
MEEGRRFRLPLTAAAAAAVLAWADATAASTDEVKYAAQRFKMVQWVQLHAQVSGEETGVRVIDPKVLAAMSEVPRHEFVPEPLKHLAYHDTAIPIGHGQSLSQPFIIALMAHLARVGEGDVVFETGTGEGYMAAVLSRLAKTVYSVEYSEVLAEQAKTTLGRLGVGNVSVRAGDPFFGWPERGPFDVIILKEAVREVPAPLLRQLKPGGRLVAPVGPLDGVQALTLVEKVGNGPAKEKRVLPVRFMPLQGGERI